MACDPDYPVCPSVIDRLVGNHAFTVTANSSAVPPALQPTTATPSTTTHTSFYTPMAPTIKVGDTIPEGSFKYVAYTPALEDHSACGIPTDLKTDEWKGKKVVLFSVPGAFTPTCHVNHLPPYLEKYDELKSKGVDVIAVVSANDAFVMSGWGRVEGLKDKILALSDPAAQWSEKLGLSVDLSGLGGLGLGTRTARYAIILDDLVVKYVEVEPSTGVTVSGVDAILAKL